MPKFFLCLRIVFSASCGIAAVLLIALWARSYVWVDTVTGPMTKAKGLMIGSADGWLQFRLDDRSSENYQMAQWTARSESIDRLHDDIRTLLKSLPHVRETPRFGINGDTLFLPYWFPVIFAATFAVLPWSRRLSWRFSLRTLLIATMLIAVVLGLVIWSVR